MFFYANEIYSSDKADSLYLGFQNPPTSAKPRTWWHWTKGNVTLDGIKKDLEWMKRVGIAGFQLADVNFGGGQTVDHKIEFGTDEWYDAVEYTAEEAETLDLEMGIFSSPGWSITGGPWVKPEQAMKKLVWSDTLLNGAQIFNGKLPQPPFSNGPFQDYGNGRKNKEEPHQKINKDVSFFSYKIPESAVEMASLKPKVETSGRRIDGKILFDGKYNSSVTVQADTTLGIAWIHYEFQKPFTAHAFTISGGNGIPVGKLSASNNGKNFTTLVNLPGAQLYRQGWVRTFSVPEISAKYFRIELTGAPLNPAETMAQNTNKKANEYVLREAVLQPQARINRWEEKAGFRLLFEYESLPTPEIPKSQSIQNKDLINLTSKLDKNGNLTWKVPEGKWDILRIGYSLTGAKNRPAVPSGSGYEVDKLSKEYTDKYIKNYLGPIKEKLGSLYGKSLRYVMMDSWEAGMQNWTDNMIDEFKKRRGYDPTPYLPALVGRVIISAEVSDRFLWDFRRTLAYMFAENHYGAISEYLKKEGIGTYGEASGVSLEILEDALLCKKFMDIPMGEFWVKPLHPKQMYYEDIRGAASAAHVYGKKIAAAESFTGGGYESPYTLKKIADYWFCQGVNRLVFHTCAHQPLDDKPGNVMVGTHLNRNITWAEEAKPFMNYLSRTSYMLQQGKFVADIA
ncbi:MAG: glycosyl hydrolase, partial [Ignavibacteriaceae bacterium]